MEAGHKSLTFEGGSHCITQAGLKYGIYPRLTSINITTLLPELPKCVDTGRNVTSVFVIVHVRYIAPMQTHDASVTLKLQAGPCQLSKVRLRALLYLGG